MGHESIKKITRRLGVYRASRWVHRTVVRRDSLRKFRDELRLYSQLFGKGDLCFDVGANCGIKSEVMLKLGARCVAFEPQEDCLQELRSRLGRQPNLTLVNAAVGARSGESTFYISQTNTASSLLPNWQGGPTHSIRVPVTTLDVAIVTYGRPRFCKVDVEGFEIEVFKGLSQAIPTISFEYNQGGEGKAKAITCIEALARLGDIRINIAPAETPTLALERWMTQEEFLTYFREALPIDGGFWYGDIYVKTLGL